MNNISFVKKIFKFETRKVDRFQLHELKIHDCPL